MVYEVHDYSDIIKFKNSIMVDKSRKNGEQPLRDTWKMKDTVTFGIMNNIREYVELVQLMDSLGNLNNEVSVVKMWIFNSN